MAKVHYFQRYSNFENTVTNNTLQLLARTHAYAPQRAADFVNVLVGVDDPVEIGLEITQQRRVADSVPDAVIVQQGFRIVVETKVDSPVSVEQLVRHTANFTEGERKILLLLTKRPIGALETDLRRKLAEVARDVIFSSVTFEDVIGALDGLFQEREYEMVDLARDYVEYCWDVGLVDRSRYPLRIVPCGRSLDINLRHGIYFHGSDRSYTAHRFTGIYKDKRVHALWENDSVFDVTLTDGLLNKVLITGRDTGEYDERIRKIIRDAKEECGYEIARGHRFFCGEPAETSFVKSSWGGIRGQRYIDVQSLVGDFADAGDLAVQLSSATWE